MNKPRQNKKNFVNDSNKNDLVTEDVVVMAGVVEAAADAIKADAVVMVAKVDIIKETKAAGEMIRWAGITVIEILGRTRLLEHDFRWNDESGRSDGNESSNGWHGRNEPNGYDDANATNDGIIYATKSK